MSRDRSDRRSVFWDDEGFSTLGMAIALLVTLSLVFSAAQVYRVLSASSDIQDVADASVLAAENEVAEFMIAVRICDAVVLSLSLTSAALFGLGVVALCVPPAAELGLELVNLGTEVLKARSSFAERASSGLNALQEALPFLAAANAYSTANANSGGVMAASYFGVATLVPAQGDAIEVGSSKALSDAADAASKDAESLKEASEAAEEAAKEANRAKEEGFKRDCGDAPAYCMYERAGALSSISSAANPLFHTVDAWSFSVALDRAREYYSLRYADEGPLSSSIDEQSNSALRKVFYRFAAAEVSRGYVIDSGDSFRASFPVLPKNTEEMKATRLYTDPVFPLGTDESGAVTLHAWAGCPNASPSMGTASVAQMEEGNYPTCDKCRFTASSLGKVAAASSSIANGFEYHYNAVARAAEDYEAARVKQDEASREAKNQAGELLEKCKEAFSEASSMRIDAKPPGYKGAISMVVNLAATPADTGFSSSFVKGSTSLGARAAVSGATLLEEESEEGRTVISSLLDGLIGDGGSALGAARFALDLWSRALRAYCDGQEAVDGAIRHALDSLPLASASGLGTWAADALSGAVSAAGFAPAKLNALKPVLVSTGYVAASDSGAFSANYQVIRGEALASSGSSASLFDSLVGKVEDSALRALEGADGVIEIVRIDFPFGEGSIPITITLPDSLRQATGGLVSAAANAVRGAVASVTGTRVWH